MTSEIKQSFETIFSSIIHGLSLILLLSSFIIVLSGCRDNSNAQPSLTSSDYIGGGETSSSVYEGENSSTSTNINSTTSNHNNSETIDNTDNSDNIVIITNPSPAPSKINGQLYQMVGSKEVPAANYEVCVKISSPSVATLNTTTGSDGRFNVNSPFKPEGALTIIANSGPQYAYQRVIPSGSDSSSTSFALGSVGVPPPLDTESIGVDFALRDSGEYVGMINWQWDNPAYLSDTFEAAFSMPYYQIYYREGFTESIINDMDISVSSYMCTIDWNRWVTRTNDPKIGVNIPFTRTKYPDVIREDNGFGAISEIIIPEDPILYAALIIVPVSSSGAVGTPSPVLTATMNIAANINESEWKTATRAWRQIDNLPGIYYTVEFKILDEIAEVTESILLQSAE